jgi:hypothetical protein
MKQPFNLNYDDFRHIIYARVVDLMQKMLGVKYKDAPCKDDFINASFFNTIQPHTGSKQY